MTLSYYLLAYLHGEQAALEPLIGLDASVWHQAAELRAAEAQRLEAVAVDILGVLVPLERVEQRVARDEPAEDVVGVDDQEEQVVPDRDDILPVDHAVGFEASPGQDPRVLRLQHVAEDLGGGAQQRQGAEADGVAHGVREELCDVRDVHAHLPVRGEGGGQGGARGGLRGEPAECTRVCLMMLCTLSALHTHSAHRTPQSAGGLGWG